MSNKRFIDDYKKEVKLIEAILAEVNVTQCERVKRIYKHAFESRVFSDQDFFESINWYAVKAISIASRQSLISSRKFEITKVRFWNSVIIVLTPLLGDHSFYETNSMAVNVGEMYNKKRLVK